MSFDPNEYRNMRDEDKLDLLRVLYDDAKKKDNPTAKELRNKELILAETQIIYNRLKKRAN